MSTKAGMEALPSMRRQLSPTMPDESGTCTDQSITTFKALCPLVGSAHVVESERNNSAEHDTELRTVLSASASLKEAKFSYSRPHLPLHDQTAANKRRRRFGGEDRHGGTLRADAETKAESGDEKVPPVIRDC